jgi:hypothetical protein
MIYHLEIVRVSLERISHVFAFSACRLASVAYGSLFITFDSSNPKVLNVSIIFKEHKTIKHSVYAEPGQDILAGSAAIPGSPPGNPTVGAGHTEMWK